MSNDFKPLQGMSDISGIEVQKWQKIEATSSYCI